MLSGESYGNGGIIINTEKASTSASDIYSEIIPLETSAAARKQSSLAVISTAQQILAK
jgi:hypothetical protein